MSNNQTQSRLTRWIGAGRRLVKQATAPLATTGEHALDANQILRQTHSRGRSPVHPGNFETTPCPVPFPESPKGFTVREARELEAIATQYAHHAEGAKMAYEALDSIDQSCTDIHTYHRASEVKWAKTEHKRVRSNQKLASTLHGLRPGYRELSANLQSAQETADHELRLINIELTGVMG